MKTATVFIPCTTRKVKHGHCRHTSASPTYRSWQMMMRRCFNPSEEELSLYKGRGITVCKRWLKFETFLADMGCKPVGLTLDRIDNDGNYEPSNCRWATHHQQARNKRSNRIFTVNGLKGCMTDLAIRFGVDPHLVCCRISRGWNPQLAITTKPLWRRKKKVKSDPL